MILQDQDVPGAQIYCDTNSTFQIIVCEVFTLHTALFCKRAPHKFPLVLTVTGALQHPQFSIRCWKHICEIGPAIAPKSVCSYENIAIIIIIFSTFGNWRRGGLQIIQSIGQLQTNIQKFGRWSSVLLKLPKLPRFWDNVPWGIFIKLYLSIP